MCAYKVGDRVRRSDATKWFSETFVGGKEIETIIKIEPNGKIEEVKLWLSNGLWVNPSMVQSATEKLNATE